MADIQATHQSIKEQIEASNAKYKEAADKHRKKVTFEVGDYMWTVLTKDRYSMEEYNKPSQCKMSPFEIVKKINDNACWLKLPSHLRISDVFNVKHLISYVGDSSDEEVTNSRMSSFQPGEGRMMQML